MESKPNAICISYSLWEGYDGKKEKFVFIAKAPFPYIKDEYVCTDFSAEVNNNADALGIRCAIVDMFYPEGYGHTIVAFETLDRGLVFVEPQFDHEVSLIVGKSYSHINKYTPPPEDDTIKRFLLIW